MSRNDFTLIFSHFWLIRLAKDSHPYKSFLMAIAESRSLVHPKGIENSVHCFFMRIKKKNILQKDRTPCIKLMTSLPRRFSWGTFPWWTFSFWSLVWWGLRGAWGRAGDGIATSAGSSALLHSPSSSSAKGAEFTKRLSCARSTAQNVFIFNFSFIQYRVLADTGPSIL